MARHDQKSDDLPKVALAGRCHDTGGVSIIGEVARKFGQCLDEGGVGSGQLLDILVVWLPDLGTGASEVGFPVHGVRALLKLEGWRMRSDRLETSKELDPEVIGLVRQKAQSGRLIGEDGGAVVVEVDEGEQKREDEGNVLEAAQVGRASDHHGDTR